MPNFFRREMLAAWLIAALAAAGYSNSFGGSFFLDDFHQITANRSVQRLSNIPAFFRDPTLGSSSVQTAGYGYRPVTLSSFALNYAWSGDGVWSYHLVNLLLHIFNCLLVFLAVLRVLGQAEGADGYPVALAAAAVFAVHPVETNSVTYISGRAVLLASFFSLLSFYLFLLRRARGGGAALLAASLLSFLLGLFSKEMAVSTLGLVALHGFIFTEKAGSFGRLKAAVLPCLPFALAAAAFIFIKRLVSGFSFIPASPYPVTTYLLSEAKALLVYLRVMALPVNLNTEYAMRPAAHVDPWVVLSIALVAAVVYLLFAARKKEPAAAFFGLWFFVSLLPESSFFPITDIVEEYRLYLPSVGLIAAAALLARRRLPPRAAVAAAAALIMLFTGLTLQRNTVWRSTYSLWRDAAEKSPHSVLAHSNLGESLMSMGRYGDAEKELRRAVALDPSYGQAHFFLALCYKRMGRAGESVAEFRRTLDVPEREKESLRRSIPGYDLGDAYIYGSIGEVYYEAGRFREAAESYEKAVRLDPDNGLVNFNLAQSLSLAGREKEALPYMEKAVKFLPGSYDAHYYMAELYLREGMPRDAAREARASLGLAQDEERGYEAQALLEKAERMAGNGRGDGAR